jgi:hypothetical protein
MGKQYFGNGTEWTVQEVNTLLSMKRAGHTRAEIAERTGRSLNSVIGQLYRQRQAGNLE